MVNRRARLVIVEDDVDKKSPLIIRDIGPWNKYLTVTNDAENVVQALVEQGKLPEGRRLFYHDSEGQLDEILVKGGRFNGFAPGPNRENMTPRVSDK